MCMSYATTECAEIVLGTRVLGLGSKTKQAAGLTTSIARSPALPDSACRRMTSSSSPLHRYGWQVTCSGSGGRVIRRVLSGSMSFALKPQSNTTCSAIAITVTVPGIHCRQAVMEHSVRVLIYHNLRSLVESASMMGTAVTGSPPTSQAVKLREFIESGIIANTI